ncbi:L,D-transpeptidase [Rhabdochromatium marinum]|uniref:L,D-transpeptidase n=1 Tax=Rhabdochromatium marinum TaxID=48729 RepID=UPI0019087FAA|nr:L,D-transpeptidase [Rhabdochromatium marinum]
MATNTGTAASVAGLHAVPPRLVATTAPGIEAAEAGYSGQPPVAPLSLEADEPLPWPPANVELPLLQEAASATQMYQWSGDGRPLSRIVIDTDRQQARFYSGDEQVGWTTVATGVDSHPTPSGEFAVLEKVANKRSNLYGRIYDRAGNLVKANAQRGRDAIPPGGRFVGAQMPHFLRLTNDGVGIHAGPIPLPGSPASHGCIRMPAEVAAQLYRQVAPGTRVTVVEGKSGRRD